MIELRHLKTLQALRETGSLVEAADRLYLTQSALSHQIKDLEDRLDCKLFVRKTRPPRFTSAGRRLLTLADEAVPLFKTAERDIARLSGGEAGRLHLCIECHSCFQWLVPCINRYRVNWPEVELDLSGGFNFTPFPALARGDIDLVITSDPVEMAGIHYVPLFHYEAMLALAKNHRLTKRAYVTPDEMAGETLITYPIDRNRLDIFTRFLDPYDLEPADTRTAELTPMMVQLVASGRGVACLPNWALTEYLGSDVITARKLGPDGLWCKLYAAIREEQLDTPFMEDFLSTAVVSSFESLSGIVRINDNEEGPGPVPPAT